MFHLEKGAGELGGRELQGKFPFAWISDLEQFDSHLRAQSGTPDLWMEILRS